jgi:hypothetical protein
VADHHVEHLFHVCLHEHILFVDLYSLANLVAGKFLKY